MQRQSSSLVEYILRSLCDENDRGQRSRSRSMTVTNAPALDVGIWNSGLIAGELDVVDSHPIEESYLEIPLTSRRSVFML